MGPVRILCVHGVGAHPPGGAWEGQWRDALASSWARVAPDVERVVDFVHYDDIFEDYDIGFLDVLEALGKLTASGIAAPFRAAGTRGSWSSSLRWTAGMVVQWVENEELRRRTRDRLESRAREFRPDVICAHSLGSLVAYDTFTEPASASVAAGRIFVSLGSQIANPFVAGNFLAGRILPLPEARHWYHLYNEEDAVFAAPIRLHAANFTQVDTYFDESGMADHSAPRYLAHPSVAEEVWSRIVAESRHRGLLTPSASARKRAPGWSRPRDRRALLVGINHYADPALDLEGCVNDVYLMSRELQEAGFDERDLRIVLDRRATAAGIRERLEWLLGDVKPGDVRFLFYSGHGAQLDGYGQGDVIDHRDETLVPHDFDWSPERAITDDWFHELYGQLPYDTNFVAIFDCCHSGGMTRSGSGRVRGITPPDDIRHRSLRWDAGAKTWRRRSHGHPCADGSFTSRFLADGGERTGLRRLGHATMLRGLSKSAFEERKRELSRDDVENHGPYMPVLLYACREDELAFEHRHGQMVYGAFTFSLAQVLRERREARRGATFEELIREVGDAVTGLGYDQHPQLQGPTHWVGQTVPGLPGGAKRASGRRGSTESAGGRRSSPRKKKSKKKGR